MCVWVCGCVAIIRDKIQLRKVLNIIIRKPGLKPKILKSCSRVPCGTRNHLTEGGVKWLSKGNLKYNNWSRGMICVHITKKLSMLTI